MRADENLFEDALAPEPPPPEIFSRRTVDFDEIIVPAVAKKMNIEQ